MSLWSNIFLAGVLISGLPFFLLDVLEFSTMEVTCISLLSSTLLFPFEIVTQVSFRFYVKQLQVNNFLR